MIILDNTYIYEIGDNLKTAIIVVGVLVVITVLHAIIISKIIKQCFELKKIKINCEAVKKYKEEKSK